MGGRIRVGLDRLAAALVDVAGWMLVAMVVLISVEILGRYFFRFSTLIADEYSGYLFVWATFLGFAHALRTGQFLRVEMLVVRLAPRLRNALEILAAAAGLVVAAIAAWGTWKLVYTSWRFGSLSIQPSATPLLIPQLIMPLGLLLLCLLYVEEIWRRLAGDVGPAAAPTIPRSE